MENNIMYVINWQINGGKDWEDCRGKVVKDNNSFLTDSSYCVGVKKSKKFDSIKSGFDFCKKWIKNQNKHILNMSESKDRITIEYDKEIDGFGKKVLIIRKYIPRKK
jgi:hypothetical protein